MKVQCSWTNFTELNHEKLRVLRTNLSILFCSILYIWLNPTCQVLLILTKFAQYSNLWTNCIGLTTECQMPLASTYLSKVHFLDWSWILLYSLGVWSFDPKCSAEFVDRSQTTLELLCLILKLRWKTFLVFCSLNQHHNSEPNFKLDSCWVELGCVSGPLHKMPTFLQLYFVLWTMLPLYG